MTGTFERSLQPHQRTWLDAIDRYRERWPQEFDSIDLFRDLMSAHADAAERARVSGHLTGSAWLVSKDSERVLLTHHRKLNRWLQPGGHADGFGQDGHGGGSGQGWEASVPGEDKRAAAAGPGGHDGRADSAGAAGRGGGWRAGRARAQG